jgi:hypothetical protein
MSEIMQSSDGRHWEPAIPLPLYSGWPWSRRFVCQCSHVSKSEYAYQQHYKRDHHRAIGTPGPIGKESDDG